MIKHLAGQHDQKTHGSAKFGQYTNYLKVAHALNKKYSPSPFEPTSNQSIISSDFNARLEFMQPDGDIWAFMHNVTDPAKAKAYVNDLVREAKKSFTQVRIKGLPINVAVSLGGYYEVTDTDMVILTSGALKYLKKIYGFEIPIQLRYLENISVNNISQSAYQKTIDYLKTTPVGALTLNPPQPPVFSNTPGASVTVDRVPVVNLVGVEHPKYLGVSLFTEYLSTLPKGAKMPVVIDL